MGGGTGLATLLRGLKRYVQASEGAVEITAVVTVTDDGGSSGRLRRDFDVLPPGDIRNCMVALCQDEALLRSCSTIVSPAAAVSRGIASETCFSWP